MSSLVRERPRPYQFELRHLYGTNTRRERFGVRFRERVCPFFEFAINASCLCGLGYLILLASFQSPAHQAAPAVKPLSSPAAERPGPCCSLPPGMWLTQTIKTASW